ncbi:TPA: hypothetical protein ACPT21_005192, partial [Klebsiella pneumoniae]
GYIAVPAWQGRRDKKPRRGYPKVNGALNEQPMTKQYIVYLNMFNHFATRTILRRSTPVFWRGTAISAGAVQPG